MSSGRYIHPDAAYAITQRVASSSEIEVVDRSSQRAPASTSTSISTPTLLQGKDKEVYLYQLLLEKPVHWLERYGRYLFLGELSLFGWPSSQHGGGTEEDKRVEFLVSLYKSKQSQTRRTHSSSNSLPVHIRNRRYTRMIQLESEGQYEGGGRSEERPPNHALSARMLYNYDNDQVALRQREQTLQAQRELQRGLRPVQHTKPTSKRKSERSSVSSDESELESEESVERYIPPPNSTAQDLNVHYGFPSPDAITSTELDALESEFISIMKDNFLQGRDVQYVNYSDIDDNSELDDDDAIGRDAEDRYFDE